MDTHYDILRRYAILTHAPCIYFHCRQISDFGRLFLPLQFRLQNDVPILFCIQFGSRADRLAQAILQGPLRNSVFSAAAPWQHCTGSQAPNQF